MRYMTRRHQKAFHSPVVLQILKRNKTTLKWLRLRMGLCLPEIAALNGIIIFLYNQNVHVDDIADFLCMPRPYKGYIERVIWHYVRDKKAGTAGQ